MVFVWTKSKVLGGEHDLITWGLNEPCSHFAIVFDGEWVYHSSWKGVAKLSLEEFLSCRKLTHKIKYKISDEVRLEAMQKIENQHMHLEYDWYYFMWLVWRAFLFKIFNIPLPDRIQFQNKGMLLCTEVVQLLPESIRPKFDKFKAVTPYRLYKILGGP